MRKVHSGGTPRQRVRTLNTMSSESGVEVDIRASTDRHSSAFPKTSTYTATVPAYGGLTPARRSHRS
jgi:hypothetical protein